VVGALDVVVDGCVGHDGLLWAYFGQFVYHL